MKQSSLNHLQYKNLVSDSRKRKTEVLRNLEEVKRFLQNEPDQSHLKNILLLSLSAHRSKIEAQMDLVYRMLDPKKFKRKQKSLIKGGNYVDTSELRHVRNEIMEAYGEILHLLNGKSLALSGHRGHMNMVGELMSEIQNFRDLLASIDGTRGSKKETASSETQETSESYLENCSPQEIRDMEIFTVKLKEYELTNEIQISPRLEQMNLHQSPLLGALDTLNVLLLLIATYFSTRKK